MIDYTSIVTNLGTELNALMVPRGYLANRIHFSRRLPNNVKAGPQVNYYLARSDFAYTHGGTGGTIKDIISAVILLTRINDADLEFIQDINTLQNGLLFSNLSGCVKSVIIETIEYPDERKTQQANDMATVAVMLSMTALAKREAT